MDDFIVGGLILVIVFFITVFFTRTWMKAAKNIGLVGIDRNKINKPKIPEAGGISVLLGFSIGLLFLIFLKTFFICTKIHLVEILAVLSTILLAGFIGYVDDTLGWKKGLKQSHKVILTIPIAIPLMVINAGYSTMSIPFIGPIDFGLLYPLIIIPIGVIGATNGFNMLAGFNGLEAGMGTIILGTLGLISFLGQNYWISFICFAMVSSLLGFLVFNKYPSKVFPGDILTYSVGALISVVAILGNMEKIAVILFIPYCIEFLFKARSNFNTSCYINDGHKKIYSWSHVLMNVGVRTEKNIVHIIWIIETILCIVMVISYAT